MKRFLFLLAALAACTAAAKVQNPATDLSAATAIRGKVLTTERQAIEFANIALLSEDSIFLQGTCSDSDGSFEILRPAGGDNYLLQISSIGYKTLCRPCHTREEALYLLEPDVVMLAETVVTAGCRTLRSLPALLPRTSTKWNSSPTRAPNIMPPLRQSSASAPCGARKTDGEIGAYPPPGEGGALKTGTDYSFIRRKDRFLNLQGILPDTDSRIDESKAAAFAEYSLSWGKVSVLAGLRYEHAVSDYWEQGAFVPGQSRVYNDWRPNFSVDFPIGKAQGSVSYTAKSNRPAFFQLRSTLSYNNRFVYEGGNPLLTPETNHDLQFSTLYRWLQVRLNYQYRRNAIAFMTKEHDENPDAVIFTTANFKRMQYLTASAHLSPSIGLWKPELGVFFVQPFFKVVNQGSTRSMNRSSVYLTLQNSFRLPGEWILSLNADYQSEGNFGAMLQRSYWGVDAGIRKVFFHRKLTVSLQANDLWNSRYGSFMLFGPRMTYTKKANPDSRCFSLNISYRFRTAGKAYRGRHAAEEDLRRL